MLPLTVVLVVWENGRRDVFKKNLKAVSNSKNPVYLWGR